MEMYTYIFLCCLKKYFLVTPPREMLVTSWVWKPSLLGHPDASAPRRAPALHRAGSHRCLISTTESALSPIRRATHPLPLKVNPALYW